MMLVILAILTSVVAVRIRRHHAEGEDHRGQDFDRCGSKPRSRTSIPTRNEPAPDDGRRAQRAGAESGQPAGLEEALHRRDGGG